MKHSTRAKTAMTKNLKGRLSWLESDLKTEQQGMSQAKKWCKLLKKPFCKSTSYKAYSNGIATTKRQIRALKILIRRRQRNGQCFKIL